MPTSWADQVSGMDYADRLGRCMIRGGLRSNGGMAYNAGTTSCAQYQEFMKWLLTPFGEQPGQVDPPRRVICGDGSVDTAGGMLDALGSSLSTSRNSGESDFAYAGRLLLA